jgi:hypothetical protein
MFPLLITTKQYIKGWKHAKEQTSCGLSILYFGHFKAGIQWEAIAIFESQMTNFPCSTGYSPLSWRQIIDVECLKQPGDYCPEKLNTIKLFHPQFNTNNKIMGREIMKHCK